MSQNLRLNITLQQCPILHSQQSYANFCEGQIQMVCLPYYFPLTWLKGRFFLIHLKGR